MVELLEQVVLGAVVTVKQMLELPHKTELRILEAAVVVLEQMRPVFQIKHLVLAVLELSLSKYLTT
jgi:hypothetical protein